MSISVSGKVCMVNALFVIVSRAQNIFGCASILSVVRNLVKCEEKPTVNPYKYTGAWIGGKSVLEQLGCAGWLPLSLIENKRLRISIPFPSQQGQSHHQRRVGQTRRVQDEIGIASNMTMAYDQRARIVAKQLLLARQQRRVQVCGDGKRGCPQMVNAISHAMKQIRTGRAEFCTTDRLSLGNGTGEQAYIDRAPKGCRGADASQQSVFHWHARGRRGIALGLLYRKRLEGMSPLAQ